MAPKRLSLKGLSPADLRAQGAGLLEKASKLQAFVQQQNERTGKSSAKKEWLLAAQELQEEREAAERELHAALLATHSHACQDMNSDTQGVLTSWQHMVASTAQLRQDLRDQVKAISAVHSSLKSYGVKAFSDEAKVLAQEVEALKQGLAQQLELLEQEVADLSKNDEDAAGLLAASRPSSGATASTPSSAAPFSSQPHANPGVLCTPPPPLGHPLARGGQASSSSTSHGTRRLSSAGGGSRSQSHAAASTAGCGATEPAELEALLAGFPLVGGSVKARMRAVMGVLQAQHEERMAEWRQEAQGAEGSEQSKAAHWPEAEHSWFVSMRERYWREMARRGATREMLMAKLSTLLPKYTVAEMLAHDTWHQRNKLLQRKRQGLLEAWRRERAQFLEDTAALLKEATQLAVERAETAADRLIHELTRERVNDELHVLRAAAAEEAEATAALRAEAEERAARERAAAELLSKEEMAAKKELVAAYRQKLQQQQAAQAAAEAAREAQEEAMRTQQASYNKARVEVRQVEYMCKQEQRRQAAEQAAEEARAREARLDRLRELVAPHVEADPARLLLPTESSMGVDDSEPGAFKAVHGYTVEQMYRDQRLKVMEALQGAGLHQTDYARQVIAAMPAAKTTRIDNLTAGQRGEL